MFMCPGIITNSCGSGWAKEADFENIYLVKKGQVENDEKQTQEKVKKAQALKAERTKVDKNW